MFWADCGRGLTPSTAGPDGCDAGDFAKTLLKQITPLLLCDNEEAVVEAARVYGNFSRIPEATFPLPHGNCAYTGTCTENMHFPSCEFLFDRNMHVYVNLKSCVLQNSLIAMRSERKVCSLHSDGSSITWLRFGQVREFMLETRVVEALTLLLDHPNMEVRTAPLPPCLQGFIDVHCTHFLITYYAPKGSLDSI
jgi:hypothetical protein